MFKILNRFKNFFLKKDIIEDVVKVDEVCEYSSYLKKDCLLSPKFAEYYHCKKCGKTIDYRRDSIEYDFDGIKRIIKPSKIF